MKRIVSNDGLQVTREDQQLALHGPFPVFTSRPDDIADDRQAEGSVPTQRTGCGALVSAQEHPLALVEIVFGPDGAERYSLRGAEAANAFGRLLRSATVHVDSDVTYDVRCSLCPTYTCPRCGSPRRIQSFSPRDSDPVTGRKARSWPDRNYARACCR